MKAVILVGGEGTRLRPLTYSAPKQMLPIVGTPMLERVLANLARHGVTEVVLSLGYLPDRFIAVYPDFTVAGLPVSYAVEPEPLDTAGAIRFAALHASVSDTFIVVNGDVITDLDVSALVAFHRENQAQATIALHPVEDPSRFGVVPTDEGGRVLAFVEKPPRDEAPSNEINAGTYVLEPSVISLIEPDVRVSVERVTFPILAERGTLFALSDSSYWLDTGTPEAYLQAHADVLSGARPLDLATPVIGGNWLHDAAEVDPSSRIASSAVDRHCRVGEGAEVSGSVMMPGSAVEPGAIVRDSIIGPGAVVRSGSRLGEICVVGADEIVDGVLNGERIGGPR